jgi:cytochrome c peroxidase
VPHFLITTRSVIPLPPGVLPPPTPPDNALTTAKVELGRHLFYDRRLSWNGTQSCASCHQQRLAFTDGRPRAIGSTGEQHFRNSMTLANVAWRRPLTWANAAMRTLEEQAIVPLTRHDPVELGMDGHLDELVARLRSDRQYGPLYLTAFPGDPDPITITNTARAIASFERTLISANSPYDRLVLRGESDALSEAAWRGMRLFFSKRLRCSSCHGGFDFDAPAEGPVFRNTGLYDRPRDRGDRGSFRVPTLRNVAETGPYMHDGSAATLSDVIDDYAAGGRAARLGHHRPARGVAIRPFRITPAEKGDLIAFLESLTDETFLSDPRYADPWMPGSAGVPPAPSASSVTKANPAGGTPALPGTTIRATIEPSVVSPIRKEIE